VLVEVEAVGVVVNHLVRARHITRRDEHGVALTIIVT
jgi:hypothetical protein